MNLCKKSGTEHAQRSSDNSKQKGAQSIVECPIRQASRRCWSHCDQGVGKKERPGRRGVRWENKRRRNLWKKYKEQGDRRCRYFCVGIMESRGLLGFRTSLIVVGHRKMGKGTTGYHNSRLLLHNDHCLGPIFENKLEAALISL